MARKRKSSDADYNARRREYRAAQRYLKKSNETTGATSAQNRALAKEHLMNALETYDPTQRQQISSQIVNLAAEFGIDVQGQREQLITSNESQRRKARLKSFRALESARKDPEKRKQIEAKEIISNPELGKRIMGGLVDIWKPAVQKGKSAAENRAAAQKAVFEYFGVDNWVDVLKKIEQNVGSELYAIGNELEIYDTVRIAIQKGVRGNTLVA